MFALAGRIQKKRRRPKKGKGGVKTVKKQQLHVALRPFNASSGFWLRIGAATGLMGSLDLASPLRNLPKNKH